MFIVVLFLEFIIKYVYRFNTTKNYPQRRCHPDWQHDKMTKWHEKVTKRRGEDEMGTDVRS